MRTSDDHVYDDIRLPQLEARRVDICSLSSRRVLVLERG